MPTEIEIRNALLQELYCQENYALNSDEAAYGIADGYFTISNEELNLKYSNSKSKWKNPNKLKAKTYLSQLKI